MDFRISGLPSAPFEPLFGLSAERLAELGIQRRIADRSPGFPCRVSLVDAARGEPVLLLNYEHLPVAGPYRSRHAIYVRENAREAHPAINEIPEQLRIRLLSLRAFDSAGLMREADVVDGACAHDAIRRMLGDPAVEFIHVHNARPGCYAARVDRA